MSKDQQAKARYLRQMATRQQKPKPSHVKGTCGIAIPHTEADHRAHDLIRGVVRGRVLDPWTNKWYKDGFAPFQLAAQPTTTQPITNANWWKTLISTAHYEWVEDPHGGHFVHRGENQK